MLYDLIAEYPQVDENGYRGTTTMVAQVKNTSVDPKKVDANAQRLVKENQEWLKKMASK